MRLLTTLLLVSTLSAWAAGISGYPCFRTVPETLTSMTNLVNAYPSMVRWTNVGTTVEGRQILGLVLSNTNSPHPKFPNLLIGAVHANEWGPGEFLLQLAERACAAYATNGDYRYVLDYSELHIIPLVNVDARVRVDTDPSNYFWRNNLRDVGCEPGQTNGVNINRNFPYDWSWGTNGISYSDVPCNNLYAGAGPASEPETQAVTNYIGRLFQDRRGPGQSDTVSNTIEGMILDLHTQAATLNHFLAWSNATNPNFNQFQALCRKGVHYTGYGINTLSRSAGTLKQHGFGEFGVPTITWEFGPLNDFTCNTFNVTTAPSNHNAFHYMVRVRRPFADPSAPELVKLASTVVSNIVTITGFATDARNSTLSEQDITDVRYSIGLPPWHESATTAPISFTKDSTGVASVSGTIDATAFAPGEYVAYLDAADGTDGYGVVSGVVFTVADLGQGEPPPATPTDATLRVIGSAIRGIPSTWRVR